MTKIPHRLYLTEEQMPKQWYNLRADMKEQPDPMLNPATLKPATVEDLYPVFCEKLAKQEMDSTTRYIDIPEEIQEIYKMYRPSPLVRAYHLEKTLGGQKKNSAACILDQYGINSGYAQRLDDDDGKGSRAIPSRCHLGRRAAVLPLKDSTVCSNLSLEIFSGKALQIRE